AVAGGQAPQSQRLEQGRPGPWGRGRGSRSLLNGNGQGHSLSLDYDPVTSKPRRDIPAVGSIFQALPTHGGTLSRWERAGARVSRGILPPSGARGVSLPGSTLKPQKGAQ